MRHTFRAAGLILRNDLRRRLRNRSFLLQSLVGPFVLALLISLAFGGGFGFDLTVGVSVADGDGVAARIQQGLVDASGGGVDFVAVDPDEDPAAWIDDQEESAALVVLPSGFVSSLAAEAPAPVEVVSDPDESVAASVALSVANEIAARAGAARLAVSAVLAEGGTPPAPEDLAGIELPITIDQLGTGDDLSPVTLVGPGMAMLFLFLTIAIIARNLLEERRDGVLDRIRAAPVSTGALLLGKAGGVVLSALVSLFVLWGATVGLLGADWGDPGGVVLVMVAASLSVAGLAGVVAAVAKTEQSADTLATGVALVLGVLGGSMVPLSELPDGLRRLSYLTPNGWTLHGFAELSAGEGTVADVLPHAGVLLAWAIVTAGIAAVLLPRRLGSR